MLAAQPSELDCLHHYCIDSASFFSHLIGEVLQLLLTPRVSHFFKGLSTEAYRRGEHRYRP